MRHKSDTRDKARRVASRDDELDARAKDDERERRRQRRVKGGRK